jgi:cadmium resistance protein CadD (predicted permease)
MEIIVTGLLAFTATNIDDIFILMLFFGNKHFKGREIITGQFLGIATLIAISVFISLIGVVVDKAYIGLLGFLPIYFGIRELIQMRRKHTDENDEIGIETPSKTNKSNVFTVAGATIANGGDNIGIYVPLFAVFAWPQKLTMISIFFFMTGVWCFLARYSIKHPLLGRTIDRYGHVLTPFVLILLGIYILYESNTLALITR